MANRYIWQSLEREMILAGVGEKEVCTFINSAVEFALKEIRRRQIKEEG